MTGSRVLSFVVAVSVSFVARGAMAQNVELQAMLSEADDAYGRGQYASAAALFDRAIVTGGTSIQPSTYAKRASIFLTTKQYEEGLAWLETVATSVYPHEPLLREQEALLLSKLGRDQRAIEVAEEVIAKRDNAYALQLMIADHYFRLGAEHGPRSARSYEAFLRHRPEALAKGDALIRAKLGFSYLRSDRGSDAAESFRGVLQQVADGPLALSVQTGLCVALVTTTQWEAATRECHVAVKSADRAKKPDPNSVLNLSRAYLETGKSRPAALEAKRYIRLRSNDVAGYVILGSSLVRLGFLGSAERRYLQASKLEPKNGEISFALGKLYLDERRTRVKKAVRHLQAASARLPERSDVLLALGRAHLVDRAVVEALEIADRGIAMNDISDAIRAEFLVLSGQGLHARGSDPRLAIKSFESALALDADKREARSGMAKALNVMAANKLEQGSIEDSAALLEQALRADPSLHATRVNLGIIALEKGAYPEAREHLEKAIEKHPKDAVIHRLLAAVYASLDDAPKAEHHYAAAEQISTAGTELHTDTLAGWAALNLRSGKADDAVKRLEKASQGVSEGELARRVRHDLHLAYCVRAYQHLRGGDGRQALADLVKVEVSELEGDNANLCSFLRGLAYLNGKRPAKARAVFEDMIERKASAREFLTPEYRRLELPFFVAYSLYAEKTDSSLGKAVSMLKSLLGRSKGPESERIADLLRSALEHQALQQLRANRLAVADRLLRQAQGYARKGSDRAIRQNQAAIAIRNRQYGDAQRILSDLGADMPEALVNRGLVYDQAGDNRKAFEAWSAARARGYRSDELSSWLDAKQRIFGFKEAR